MQSLRLRRCGRQRALSLGRSRGSLCRRSLELEGKLRLGELRWRLSDDLDAGGEGALLVDAAEAAKVGRGVARRQGVLAESGRLGREHAGRHRNTSHARRSWETRGVGSRLRAKLCKVEIGAGAVTNIHGLVQAALGVVAVEDDAVEQDADDLKDDFDDDADEGPVLQAAHQGVLDLVGEDLRSGVLHAGPSPHVFVVAVAFRVGEDGGGKNPENKTDNELERRC